MSKSMKAALLTIFLGPGIGHLYLKRYVIGGSLITLALVSLYYLTTQAFKQASEIIAQMGAQNVPPDIATLTEMVKNQPPGPDATLQSVVSTLLLVAWIGGTIHSYIAGRKAK